MPIGHPQITTVLGGKGRGQKKETKLRDVIYGRPLVYQSLLTTTTIYLYLATLDNHFSVTIVERGIATHTRQPLLLPRSLRPFKQYQVKVWSWSVRNGLYSVYSRRFVRVGNHMESDELWFRISLGIL